MALEADFNNVVQITYTVDSKSQVCAPFFSSLAVKGSPWHGRPPARHRCNQALWCLQQEMLCRPPDYQNTPEGLGTEACIRWKHITDGSSHCTMIATQYHAPETVSVNGMECSVQLNIADLLVIT